MEEGEGERERERENEVQLSTVSFGLSLRITLGFLKKLLENPYSSNRNTPMVNGFMVVDLIYFCIFFSVMCFQNQI